MSSDSSIAKLHSQPPALFSKFQYQKTQRNKASEVQKSAKQGKKKKPSAPLALEILLRCPFLESIIYTEKKYQKPKPKKKNSTSRLTAPILELYIEILQTRPTHTHTQSFLQVQETMKHTSTQTWPTQI
jgi:pyruvate/2-oxoacid:ferredoxin oxidoreductase beta subunit